MSAHVMRVEWDGGGFPTYGVVCNEPEDALCRAEWDCDCEEYAEVGMGDDGRPWHSLTDGYLTDEEQRSPDRTRHHGRTGGSCNYANWLNGGDCIDELGLGSVDIPVTFAWDGDGYEWHVAEDGAS